MAHSLKIADELDVSYRVEEEARIPLVFFWFEKSLDATHEL